MSLPPSGTESQQILPGPPVVPVWYPLPWVVLALLVACGDTFLVPDSHFLNNLWVNLVQAVPWALLGLFLLWLAARYPVVSLRDRRHIALHVGATVVLGFFAACCAFWIMEWLWDQYAGGVFVGVPAHRRFFSFVGHWYFVYLLVLSAVTWSYHWYLTARRLRFRELAAAQLALDLAQAENRALRAQLQPHFLLNALNSVSALVHDNPDGAERMLARLGDFLRGLLAMDPAQSLTLRQELALLGAYTDIERIRFGDRLVFRVQAEEACLDHPVPPLLLQPLVENAIKHGVRLRPEGGTITVRAALQQDSLVLEVHDDGPGQGDFSREGVGLSNIRARLNLLHGESATFDLNAHPGSGTLARICLPLAVAG